MITLDKEKCTNCGICNDVCPNYCFTMTEGNKLQLVHPEHCCDCGHCISLCPPGALSHEAIPRDELIQFSRSVPAPDAMKELLQGRRSIRIYKDRQVSDADIQTLLDVGMYAGTSSNGQTEGFLVVQNRGRLLELERLVIQTIWDAGLKYLGGGLMRKILLISPELLLPDFGTKNQAGILYLVTL